MIKAHKVLIMTSEAIAFPTSSKCFAQLLLKNTEQTNEQKEKNILARGLACLNKTCFIGSYCKEIRAPPLKTLSFNFTSAFPLLPEPVNNK